MRQGFTLTELLVVVGILALLAGILLPVFAAVREKGRRTVCLSHAKQLGSALLLYAQDNEEQSPDSVLSSKISTRHIAVNMGWAGRIYPYLKTAEVYHCPDDPTEQKPDSTGTVAQPVSYGLNSNLSITSHLASFAAPARTVLLFEVVGNRVRLQEPGEGAESIGATDQLSASGDGTDGGLLDVTQTVNRAGRTRYATGVMDNAQITGDSSDDHQGENPRHRTGSNYLAADGHTVFLTPDAVSAGRTAKGEADAQKKTGCPGLNPAYTLLPCAAGTAQGKHTLTFSTL